MLILIQMVQNILYHHLLSWKADEVPLDATLSYTHIHFVWSGSTQCRLWVLVVAKRSMQYPTYIMDNDWKTQLVDSAILTKEYIGLRPFFKNIHQIYIEHDCNDATLHTTSPIKSALWGWDWWLGRMTHFVMMTHF